MENELARLTINNKPKQEIPQYCFGVIADVQYADLPNGHNYQKTRTRYYKNAIVQLQHAVSHWNSMGNVSSVIQLGDLIDGANKQHIESESAMDAVTTVLHRFNGPVYNVLGNHDLYNFSRSALLDGALFKDEELDLPLENCACFQICPIKGYKFIFLDQYSFSMLGYDKASQEYINSEAFLKKRNHNTDLNSPEGLKGFSKRFLKFNGAVDELQLDWFDEMLSRAEAKHEKVLVFGHLPIYHPSSCSMCLCWNHDKLLEIIHKYDNVLAYIAGHDHDGGAAKDEKGVQHITLEGVVETRPGVQCFATVNIFNDKICFMGSGRIPNYTIEFNNKK